MAKPQTELERFLEDLINKNKGIHIPVKASVFERLTKKKISCDALRPNPDDEFCVLGVGPSYRIISEYEEKFRRAKQHDMEAIEEPIFVEKMHPEGYMILNGHHRWAAAMRCGIKKIPVKIVNLTQETDIEKMIENSKHDKRATFDLDEVVLRGENDKFLDKPLKFPSNRFYKERIKLGIPALFHFLVKNGYDIWLFSEYYYSYDYIEHLFRKYHVHVDGIVTGTKRKGTNNPDKKASMEKIEKLFKDTYRETVTIDNNMIVRIPNEGKDFEQFDLDCTDETWSREVISIMEKIKKDE